MPAYPPGSLWTFNPLAWQFLFVFGAVLGQTDARQRGAAALLRLAYVPAIIVAIAALTIRLSWMFHGFHENFPALFLRALWPVNKSNLAPIRLVSFFALFVLVARWVPPRAMFLRSAWTRPVVLVRQPLARNLLPQHFVIGARSFPDVGNHRGVQYAARGQCHRHRRNVSDGGDA